MILWDVGTAMTGAGVLTPSSPYVRVVLSSIPAYFSQTADVPPRYYNLGKVGWMDGDGRAYGQALTYADQILETDLAQADGIYWILPTGVSGTIYRGVPMSTELPVGARVYGTAAQTLTTGTGTALTFDAERFDPFGMHDTAGAPTRLTAKEAGWYMIGGSVQWASNPTGRRALTIRYNGTNNIAKMSLDASATNATPWQTITTGYFLNLGDYVELQAEQTSGGNLDISVLANISPEFWAAKAGG